MKRFYTKRNTGEHSGIQRYEVWERLPRDPRGRVAIVDVRLCEITCGGRNTALRIARALNANEPEAAR